MRTNRNIHLAEDAVVERMRDGARLMPMHNLDGGVTWYLVPGGAVDNDLIHVVLARQDVTGSKDAQFPGIPQVFKYRRVA